MNYNSWTSEELFSYFTISSDGLCFSFMVLKFSSRQDWFAREKRHLFFFTVCLCHSLSSFFVPGFKRKEFRGKLAIAITANFINRNTTAEAKVEEISGVAFIFNQKFFLDLKEETGRKQSEASGCLVLKVRTVLKTHGFLQVSIWRTLCTTGTTRITLSWRPRNRVCWTRELSLTWVQIWNNQNYCINFSINHVYDWTHFKIK